MDRKGKMSLAGCTHSQKLPSKPSTPSSAPLGRVTSSFFRLMDMRFLRRRRGVTGVDGVPELAALLLEAAASAEKLSTEGEGVSMSQSPSVSASIS